VKAAFEYAVLFLEITLKVEAYRKDQDQGHLDAAAKKHRELARLARAFAERDTFSLSLANRSTIAPTGRFRKMYYYKRWEELFDYLSSRKNQAD
jgi:hypothetical protein